MDIFSQALREHDGSRSLRPEDFNFVITTAMDDSRKIRCSLCGRTRKILSMDFTGATLECSHTVHGPFAECPEYFFTPAKEKENFCFAGDIYSASVSLAAGSQFRKIIDSTIERKRIGIEEFFSKGEDCIPKNRFLYELQMDDKDFRMKVTWHEIREGTVLSRGICLDLKNGKVWGDWENRDDLPPEILGQAFSSYMELISRWCGFAMEVHPQRISAVYLKELTEFPFCPGISKIIGSPIVKRFRGKCDRTNPECYRQLCRSLKIDDCKTVRKSFAVNPQSLLTCKILRHAGFRDINIISRIMNGPLTDAIRDNDFEDYAFYLRKARLHCSEKKLEAIILSNMEDEEYYLRDGIAMFRKYYRHVGRALKNSIFKSGFTKLNHDALAVISASERKRNVRFKYTAGQKLLEDNVGDFVFRLPRNSRKLVEIGNELHNCVASYAWQIRDRQCTVVYAMRGKKCEICIEIRGREVVQQRGRYNLNLEGDAAVAMEKYAQRHDLYCIL